MCHSPLVWAGGKPEVTGAPEPAVRDVAAEEARSAAASKMSRYFGVLVLALVLLVIGGALAYRAFADNADKVTRDSRGFVVLTVDGVKLTFPDPPESKSFGSDGQKGEVRLLTTADEENTALAAMVMKVPAGTTADDLANPQLATAVVQSISGVASAEATAVNRFSNGPLSFLDLSGAYDQGGKQINYSMRMITGHGRLVVLVGAGSAGLPSGWAQLRDEVRIPG